MRLFFRPKRSHTLISIVLNSRHSVKSPYLGRMCVCGRAMQLSCKVYLGPGIRPGSDAEQGSPRGVIPHRTYLTVLWGILPHSHHVSVWCAGDLVTSHIDVLSLCQVDQEDVSTSSWAQGVADHRKRPGHST